MLKFVRFAACSIAAFVLSATMVVAQTLDGPVSGTLIIDGNDFMQGQHMSDLINSGSAMTQRNLERLMTPAGGGGGAGAGQQMMSPGQMAQIATSLGDKARALDKFTPSESTTSRTLAAKLAAGDEAKRARLQTFFDAMLAKYHRQGITKPYISAPYSVLLVEGYAAEGGLPEGLATDKARMSQLLNATQEFVAALQLANHHALTNAQKQQTFDTVAISVMALGSAYDLAEARHDAQLKAKVAAQAAGMVRHIFGCVPGSTPFADCVKQVSQVSTRYEITNRAAFLSL